MYADCADVLVASVLSDPLLYVIPQNLIDAVHRGTVVLVPLGRMKVLGVVVRVYTADIDSVEFDVKEIYECIHDEITLCDDVIELITWLRDYYFTTTKSVLETIIPVAIRSNAPAKTEALVSCTEEFTHDVCESLKKKTPEQYRLGKFLIDLGKQILKKELKNFSSAALKALERKCLVKIEHKILDRTRCYDEFFHCDYIKEKNVIFSKEQLVVADDIRDSIASKSFHVHLLNGVTGSGKTEVYLCGIRNVLSEGGDVIYLVPELSLTPQTVSRIRKNLRIDSDQIVVWHSGLSDGERRDAWLSIASGRAKVVIGARSAIFSPLKNVRLIIVDEEHETTYKQEENPRYNARDVAVYRSKLCNAVCVLGSATPSVESMYNASIGKYKSNKILHRVDGSKMPDVEIVDMRYEKKKVLSQRLIDLIDSRLQKKEQSILFVNKRGFASVVFCNSCDYVATCPHCSTSLTYHKNKDLLCCHLCDYVECFPKKCPKCGGGDLLQSGIGTQKVVNAVQSIFPYAKVERMDSDAMTTKDCFYKTLDKFGNGEIDILVGTQMISKGLDFPNISLVGIINIDNAINFPDFRSNERAFQSIVQVSGRAGRGNKDGIVVVQTHCAESQLIKIAINGDVDLFFKNEIKSREEFLYPPFSRIIRIIFSGHSERKTAAFANMFYNDLCSRSNGMFEVRSVSPAIIQKKSDRYRYSIFCFTKSVYVALASINATKSLISNKDIRVIVDVDQLDMM